MKTLLVTLLLILLLSDSYGLPPRRERPMRAMSSMKRLPSIPSLEFPDLEDVGTLSEYMTQSYLYKFLESFIVKSIEQSIFKRPPMDPLAPVDVTDLEREIKKKKRTKSN